MLSLLEEDQSEKQITRRGNFDTDLEEAICQIEAAYREKQSQDTARAMSSPSKRKEFGKFKLPKPSPTQVPGDPAQWTPFWDSFSSIIDQHEALSVVYKLNI